MCPPTSGATSSSRASMHRTTNGHSGRIPGITGNVAAAGFLLQVEIGLSFCPDGGVRPVAGIDADIVRKLLEPV